jgi:hypothetical protein
MKLLKNRERERKKKPKGVTEIVADFLNEITNYPNSFVEALSKR